MIIEQPEGQAAPTTETNNPEPVLSLEQEALSAMDAGLATEAEVTLPAAPAATAPAAPATEPAVPVPGTPEAAAAAAAAAAVVDPTQPAADPAKPVRDEATEAEIKALGLKEGKSAERFRAMAGEIKTLAPLREALDKAGIKDVAQLPELARHASDYRELIGMVQDTGATPEQYGMSLDYLKVVNAANGGDRAAAERAYEMVSGELATLAKLIGKPVPGVHDPLEAHVDLKQMVADGDITPAAALEMAQLRQGRQLDDGRQRLIDQQKERQQQQDQASAQGVASLNALGAELAAADPHYAAKAPALVAALQEIRDKVPPAAWAATARALYSRLPNPVAAPAPATVARPAPGPVRGNNVRPAVVAVTDDPFEAMGNGIAAANG